MSTEPFFNPSPATQGQLLEALASGQFSVNQLAESLNTTSEALSLFITTDSFATRFAAIGSTNASLIRFSASLNLFSALKLLNTLALKLDDQLRTVPVDYTNPLSIEQFRRRADCARQVAAALYRLSRFTHEPPRARAANSNFGSDSYNTSHQARTPAPAIPQTPNDPRDHFRAPWHDQPHAQQRNQATESASNQPLPTPAPTSNETRGSGTSEPSDPGTNVPAPCDQPPHPTINAAPAQEPAHEPAPRSDPSPSPSATSRAASVTSVFLPSSPAFPASLPASTPAPPPTDPSPSPSATSRAASETSVFLPSSPAFPSSEPLDDESLEALANQLLAFTNFLESQLPQPAS